jgi:predicted permease
LQVAVRLHHGVTDAAAAAELHGLAHAFSVQSGSNQSHWDLNLRDAAHFERGLFNMIGSQLPVLLGASVLLMVLVCINIASLLGQHAARRRREVAVRSALGASPVRIAKQVLAETGLLASAGALAGWAASVGMAHGLCILLPDFGVPLAFYLHSDLRILIFVVALAVMVTIACGIYPVRQSLRVSQNEALHEGGASVLGSARRISGQRLLLGLQLGICFVVLVCCGLLVRTVLNIVHRTVGFDRTNCLTAELDLERAGYSEKEGLAFQTALLDRLRPSPAVKSVTLTSHPPMGDDNSGNTQDIRVPGYVPAKGEEMSVITDYEGPEFFRILGIALRQGRGFTTADTSSSPSVVVLNEPMAHHYWPHADAVGRTILVAGHSLRIVGIVDDFAYSDPASTDAESLLFLPLTQRYSASFFVVVRPRSSLTEAAAALRQVVASLDSSLPVENVRTMEELTAERYQMAGIPAELISVYAISSVLVAMLGLYAVMAYSVVERHREFALRIALGSTRAAVFRLVLGESAWIALMGFVTGGLGSIAAVHLVRSMLFGVTPFDLVSYCVAAFLLLVTVFVSGAWPAHRAASIEPMQALRME